MEEIGEIKTIILSLKGNIKSSQKDNILELLVALQTKWSNPSTCEEPATDPEIRHERPYQSYDAKLDKMSRRLDEIQDFLRDSNLQPTTSQPITLQPTTQPTYANMAARPATQDETKNGPSVAPLILSPTTPSEPEVTKALITESLNITKLGVGVISLKTRSNGDVVIQSATLESRQKLQQEITKHLHKEISIKIPKLRSPYIIIKNLPPTYTPTEVTAAITQQNGINPNPNDITYRFSIKTKTKTSTNMIFQTTTDIYKQLITLNKININWTRHALEKFIPVISCYKCQQNGHFAKDCLKNITCGKCAAEHSTASCTAEAATCALCTHSPIFKARATGHRAVDRQSCPTLAYLAKLIDLQTDYGNGHV